VEGRDANVDRSGHRRAARDGGRRVNLWVAVLVIALAAVTAVAGLLLVRRRAPAGGFFADPDRAAGVFGVLGTSFAVLLAFVIFLAFESYDTAREKAGVEAVAVTELSDTAELFPPRTAQALRGELVCYARSVIGAEWRTMRDGRPSPLVEGWLTALAGTLRRAPLAGEKQAAAYGAWLDQMAQRREGRRGRLAEATPLVPAPLWLVLILGACLVVGYMCLYADPAEPRFVQAAMIGAITAVVVSGLLIVRFLDHPYEDHTGSIKPVEMTRTLGLMQAARRTVDPPPRVPCDAVGRPAPA
jgi:Protein of unknown function (DUF4239)